MTEPALDPASILLRPATTPEEEREAARYWRKHVYQGDKMPQLTVRAVITGALLGGVMSLSNLYVGMKTGWGLGVTITSCILAYALFSTLQRAFPRLFPAHFTILENNMMASTASSAGYMSSSIFVGAVPALYLCAGQTIGWFELSLWASAVSFLGVFMAIPMKRQQINQEQLPFPSGIATAETLRAMHTEGAEAKLKAKSLGLAGLLGALMAFMQQAMHWFPDQILQGWSWMGQAATRLTFGLDTSLVMVGAGAIMGLRVCVSLLVGAAICYGILGPWVIGSGWCNPEKFRQTWALWPGVGLLVASGLTSFVLRWKTIARAFSGLGKLMGGKSADDDDPLADIEAPGSWFLTGTLLAGGACIALGVIYFHIAWWMGVIAIVMTFFLALIASRATGETDITPTGAMGKITQLMFGVIAPGHMVTNLMTASLTGGAAIHSADLLTDLKCGYVLGANPRKQLIAQLFGVLAGTAFVVPAYLLLIPPEKIGGNEWPAPAAQIWAGVAKMFGGGGLDALPTGAKAALVIGALVGIALALVEEYIPKHLKKWTPSSTGIGIAFVVPAFNSLSMFLGALIAWIVSKRSPQSADRYILPVSSGIIAGETIMAVLVKALVVFGVLSGG